MEIKKEPMKDFHTRGQRNSERMVANYKTRERIINSKTFLWFFECLAVRPVVFGSGHRGGHTLTDLSVTFTAGHPCPTPRTRRGTTRSVEQQPHEAVNQLETTRVIRLMRLTELPQNNLYIHSTSMASDSSVNILNI